MARSEESQHMFSVVVGCSKLSNSEPLAPEQVIGQRTVVYSVLFREAVSDHVRTSEHNG